MTLRPRTAGSAPGLSHLQPLVCADAFPWLRALPDESVDLVLTDPPYESLEKHRAVGTTTRLKQSKASSNERFGVIPNARFAELFEQFYRVLKPNRHLYMFVDQETAFAVKPMGEAVGFRFWKPLVWDKVSIGMGYHYRNTYEFILFFEKGKRKLNDLRVSDVLRNVRVRNGYPAEKPLPVCSVLVHQSTQPGELVIDPFMGSGTSLAAASLSDRRFAGCDVNPRAVELARARLGLTK